MNIIKKQNIDIPNLNIESFGVYWKTRDWDSIEHFSKYYIASLEYHVKTLFGGYNKVVYLPLLFFDEDEIKSIMSHYSDIYFIIRFKYGYSSTHYSDLYHISNFIDFEKIYKNELEAMESKPCAHGIDFVIRDYKGYDIVINGSYPTLEFIYSDNYACSPADIEFLYSKNNDKDCISLIKENYRKFPKIASYSIKNDNNEHNQIYNTDKFDKMIKHIDKIYNEYKERKNKLDSMYSKKSFRLVEN